MNVYLKGRGNEIKHKRVLGSVSGVEFFCSVGGGVQI